MSKSALCGVECETCGRNLRVRVEYLGKHVVCQHCKSQFKATDAVVSDNALSNSTSTVLKRDDELLAAADAIKNRPR